MKIRTQVGIAMGGIILIPLLVILTLGIVSYYNQPEQLLLPGYEEINRISAVDIKPGEWKQIQKVLQRLPADVQVAVLTNENIVVLSTIPEMPINMIVPSDALLDFIRITGKDYYYQLERPARKQYDPFTVLLRIPRHRSARRGYFINTFGVMLAVLIVLILFCSVMLSLIVRSITRSITVLEKATRQMSLGNLDDEVVASGSNEITSLTESLNRMRISLKEEQIRRSRFIMGVSHDLRTPIALIKGYAEALSDGMVDDPEMKKKSLEIVQSKITQLEDMVNELINFVKLDTGEWRQNLELRAIKPFLGSFATRLASDANLLGFNVVSDIDIEETLQVKFDERLFLRALENLTGNAMRYTAKGGEIRFGANTRGGKLVVVVSDNGRGIAAEDMPFIFDPFYRGSNSRREDGSGLGLSVVKSIIASHGWSISAESRLGEGTSFIIEIPLDEARRV